MAWLTSLVGATFSAIGWLVLAIAVAVAVALHIFKALIPAWVAPLVIVLLGCAFVGSNLAQKSVIAQLKSDHATVLVSIATKTLETERQVRASGEAWAAAIAAQDAKSTEELNHAKTENNRLRAAARAGTASVRIHGAICPDHSGLPEAAPGARLGAPEAEAQGELRERVFDLREAVIEAETQIDFLQGYARACATLNANH